MRLGYLRYWDNLGTTPTRHKSSIFPPSHVPHLGKHTTYSLADDVIDSSWILVCMSLHIFFDHQDLQIHGSLWKKTRWHDVPRGANQEYWKA